MKSRDAQLRQRYERQLCLKSTALGKLLELSTGEGGVPYALRLAEARAKLEDGAGVEDALKRALSLDQANADVRGRLKDLYEKGKKWAELAEMLMGDVDLVQAAHPEAREPAAPPAAQVKGSIPPGAGAAKSASPGGASLPPPALPATLAEVNFDAWDGLDFYDVSMVDGSNLPMYIDTTSSSGGTVDPISQDGCGPPFRTGIGS